MEKPFTLALGQMAVVVGQAECNAATAWGMAAQAAAASVELLLLPELWGHGYDLVHARRYATTVDAGLFAEMAAMAKAYGLWVGGSLLGLRDADQTTPPFNLFALFRPDGSLAARYAKLHRFRLMDEDRFLAAGDEIALVDHAGARLGVAICYDLRFPELFRRYASHQTTLMLLPAQWPRPRLAHWRTLLRARAIENQMFVAACNRVGRDPNGTDFFGHSAIIDPWGETVVEGDDQPALLTATIDLSLIDEVRRRLPVWDDRCPEMYGLKERR